MGKYRNPNIKPYETKDGKNYYLYCFDLLCQGKKRLHYCLLYRLKYLNLYGYDHTTHDTFLYNSYFRIFKSLYLNFFANGNWTNHDYFILSPSVKVKIEKEYYYA